MNPFSSVNGGAAVTRGVLPAAASIACETRLAIERLSHHALRPHVLALDPGDNHRLLHRVAAERLAELLVEDHLDKGCDLALLRRARLFQCRRQFVLRFDRHALETATLRNLGVAQIWVE